MKSGSSLAPNLVTSLLSWYRASGRDLPWRRPPGSACQGPIDPYPVLLSEFMLQQTTVPAVLPYFRKWMEKFPNLQELAAADAEEVLREWEGLGYYSRARNLHAAAREVVGRYAGAIPDGKEELKKLPGVGEYTAAAVASIAFGARVPALDANNMRVWSRLLASSDRKRIARVFSRVIPHGRPGDFNQALMDLGSAVCTPREPRCPECPLSAWCRAFRLGRVQQYPERKPRPETTCIEAAVGIIVRDGKILVQKRPESGLLGGLWEFPGGKVGKPRRKNEVAQKKDKPSPLGDGTKEQRGKTRQRGDRSAGRRGETGRRNDPAMECQSQETRLESSSEAVVREVREETGLQVRVIVKLGEFTHSYTRFRVRLHAFVCEETGGALRRPEARWVTLLELDNLPMPSANRRIVKTLKEHFKPWNFTENALRDRH